MKTKTSVLILAAGLFVPFVLLGCGPKGGTVTIVNDSSYELLNMYISLGNSEEETLAPGQWMKASVDTDTTASAMFSLLDGEDNVKISMNGKWLLNRWSSSLFSVNGGDAHIITVTNKTE